MEGLLGLVNVAIFSLFLFLATNGASIPAELREDNKNGSIVYPESIYLIGMADGKGFFVDNDVHLNWTDAKAYCESFNMQLASITSEAQAKMLNNSYHAVNFDWGNHTFSPAYAPLGVYPNAKSKKTIPPGPARSAGAEGYWTSGRDVHDLQQFIWETENKQPDRTYLTFRSYYKDKLTCLYYESLEGNSFVMNAPCTQLVRPLCDTGNLSSNK